MSIQYRAMRTFIYLGGVTSHLSLTYGQQLADYCARRPALYVDMERFPWPIRAVADDEYNRCIRSLGDTAAQLGGVPSDFMVTAWLDGARLRSAQSYARFVAQRAWTRAELFRSGYLDQVDSYAKESLNVTLTLLPQLYRMVRSTYLEGLVEDVLEVTQQFMHELEDPDGFRHVAIADIARAENDRREGLRATSPSLHTIRPADEPPLLL